MREVPTRLSLVLTSAYASSILLMGITWLGPTGEDGPAMPPRQRAADQVQTHRRNFRG